MTKKGKDKKPKLGPNLEDLEKLAKDAIDALKRDDEEEQETDPVKIRQILAIESFIAVRGDVTKTCNAVGISERTWWRWLKDPIFVSKLNEYKIRWEIALQSKALNLALGGKGNTTMIIFLSKFLNPLYDDNFRARVLAKEMEKDLYERNPIPQPKFLPPEIPERFMDTRGTTNGDKKNNRGK